MFPTCFPHSPPRSPTHYKRISANELNIHFSTVYPLFVISCIRAVKYGFKLLHTNENRLPKQAYHMQINMELNGKCCWASRLRDLLCKFTFGFVWLEKSVGNQRAFLAILKERLCGDFNQEWTTAINSSESFCL